MKKYKFLPIFLFIIGIAFAANDEGKAKGELQVNDDKVQLKHAYAVERKGKLSVVLSDRPISEPALENSKNLVQLAEDGELRAIEVVIRSNEIAEEVFFFDDRLPSKLSVKEPGPFTPKKVNEKLIAGKLVMNDPGFSFGYTVQFSAPIVKIEPKPASRVGPGATPEDEARAALENMELEFNTDTFREVIRNGNVEAVKLFLQAGAQPLVNELAALATAVEARNVEIAKILIEAGADCNGKDQYGGILLFNAVHIGQPEMIETLIKGGADVNTKSDQNLTILMSAADAGHKDVVEALLQAGANVKARTTYGSTALSMAVYKGHNDIVKILIDAGADVARDSKELLKFAQEQKYSEIEKMLQDATPKE